MVFIYFVVLIKWNDSVCGIGIGEKKNLCCYLDVFGYIDLFEIWGWILNIGKFSYKVFVYWIFIDVVLSVYKFS